MVLFGITGQCFTSFQVRALNCMRENQLFYDGAHGRWIQISSISIPVKQNFLFGECSPRKVTNNLRWCQAAIGILNLNNLIFLILSNRNLSLFEYNLFQNLPV